MAAAAAVIVLVYAPGLSGDLYLDSTKLYQLERLYSEQHGDVAVRDLSFNRNFGRVVAQMSFYANIAISGRVDPFSIRATNLAIHLLNALLVFILASQLLARTRYRQQKLPMAALVSIVWVVSAVNMSGVLYAVQRMNQLAAMFSLLALITYVHVRSIDADRLRTAARALILVPAISAFMSLGYASKENALLIPVFIVLIELYLFPDLPGLLQGRVARFSGVLAVLAVSALCAWLLIDSNLLDYSSRGFSLQERLLTETRVIWHYIGRLLLPMTAATGLYQDGFPVSVGLLSPPTTLASLAGLLALVVCAVKYWSHETLGPAAFGLAFFLGGHLLESTVLPLELYFEHRNYLPSVGFYLSLCVLAWHLSSGLAAPQRLGIALVYIAFLGFVGHAKSSNWSEPRDAYAAAVERRYVSPRAASGLAQVYLNEGRPRQALALLDRVIAESPDNALKARLQQLYVTCQAGLPADPAVYEQLPGVTGRELPIEVSQALSNLVNVYHASGCVAIDPDRLIPVLKSVSGALRAESRTSWHIDFYIAGFYAEQDTQLAADWLSERFLDGEESAGWVLRDLLASDTTITVNTATRQALAELRGSE